MRLPWNREKDTGLPVVSIDPGALIQRGIDRGLPLDQMERLLTMRRELEAERAKKQFFVSLSTFQKDCPVVVKSALVDFATRTGRTSYKYAPLDVIVGAVKEVLERHGFSYTIKTEQSATEVTSICEAHHVDGHTESTSFRIPIDATAYMNDAQKVASAMTYSKRYAFCNAFGIMTGEDDDDARGTNNGSSSTASPGMVGSSERPATDDAKWIMLSKTPGAYWAKKGNKEAQQLVLVEAFGPGTYKVEKTEEGWMAFRRVEPETVKAEWTPESEGRQPGED